jgi:VanZ family protein
VPKIKSLLRYWLPVLIWMALIFCASSDRSSWQHSSRIIAPLVRWLFPQLSERTVDDIVFGARKCAHVTEYAIFATLLWRAFRKPVKQDPRPWKSSEARFALFLASLYSATDEFHQTFVPTRQGSVWDVLLDTTGAALGLLFLWLLGRWRNRW